MVNDEKTVLDELVDAAEAEYRQFEAIIERRESRFRSFLRRIFGNFRAEAKESVDDLFDQIESLADSLDARVDHLIEVGQRTKIEAEDEIAALSRRIAAVDGDISRTLELGKKAQGLQDYVRAARQGR